MIDRGDYWQCAYVIPKGRRRAPGARGLALPRAASPRSLRRSPIASASSTSWDDVKLLTVAVDRLKRWYRPGLLCIGDAAHAMSPVGGVGINLAIQDAVAAANILAQPLRERRADRGRSGAVQKRREFPMRVTQAIQVLVQNRSSGADARAAPRQAAAGDAAAAAFPGAARPAGALDRSRRRPEHIHTAPRWSEKEPPVQA